MNYKIILVPVYQRIIVSGFHFINQGDLFPAVNKALFSASHTSFCKSKLIIKCAFQATFCPLLVIRTAVHALTILPAFFFLQKKINLCKNMIGKSQNSFSEIKSESATTHSGLGPYQIDLTVNVQIHFLSLRKCRAALF